jgi:hypothetical protein
MDSLLNILYVVRRPVRMASLVLTSLSVLFSVPLSGTEFEANTEYGVSQMTNILSLQHINNPQSILDELGGLEGIFEASQNPLEEARTFLVSFINEINFKYGMRLTLDDAFHLVRANISSMPVSGEENNSMFVATQLLELGSLKELDLSVEEQIKTHRNVSAKICWPGIGNGLV